MSLLNVIDNIKEYSARETDLGELLNRTRLCLVRELQLKMAWTALKCDGEILVCEANEGSRAPIEIPRPVCALGVLSSEDRNCFESPSRICDDCRLFSECRRCKTLCLPIHFDDELYGVLGVVQTLEAESSANIRLSLEVISAQLAVAIRLVKLENDRVETGLVLQKVSKKLKVVLSGGTLGLWDWDVKRGKLSFDERWKQVFELDEKEVSAEDLSNPWETIVMEGHQPAVAAAQFSRIDDAMSFFESEHHVRVKSNQWKWVLIKGSVVERTDDGEPLRVSGTIQDITVRKKNEEENDKLTEQLRQIQKIESVGRLAGGIAHDLNNLLSPVIGYSEMALLDLNSENSLYEDISQIHDAAKRAKDLTHQLLAFSRKQVLKMKALSINDIVSKSEKILRRLIREDIEIIYHLAPDLSTVRGDPSQIQQILMNLAMNAADSMPSGGKIIVETSNVEFDRAYVHFHPVAEEGPYALLSVSDTGFGMDRETLGCIFDPFFTTKKKGQGTGLGLSTVYGIVKQHEGYIWAYSEPQMGTTLKAYIPIVEEEIIDAKNSSYGPEVTFGTETVMVVEDEVAVRRLICKILNKQGYDVVEAISAKNAIEIASGFDSQIDLLLTDVVMPFMNGKQLYDKIVAIRPDIKVLFVSGYTDDVIAHHGVLEGGLRFVQKPFSVESLTSKVRKTLDD